MPPARLIFGRPALVRGIIGCAALALAIGLPAGAATAQDATAGAAADLALSLADTLPPIDKASDTVLQIDSAGQLAELMDQEDFSLEAVREAKQPVPRLFVAELPADLTWGGAADRETKELFVGALLPLLLHVNEDILRDRGRVLQLQDLVRQGQFLTLADRIWLAGLAERYRVDDLNFTELLDRIDVIPPSMALAQAAVESGWGTSSLARDRNALFGQVAVSSTPDARRYVHFGQLRDSAEAYASNLNTNGAYAEFRRLRAAARAAGEQPSGYDLLAGIRRYSELGQGYINFVRGVIVDNDLASFDQAELVQVDPVAGGSAI